MSLSSETNRIRYTGTAAVAVYAYTFKIFDDDDIKVVVKSNAATPVETTLTKTTHYTLSGVGETSGGNVTLVNGAFDWITGGFLKTDYTITFARNPGAVQNLDIRNGGSYHPENIEDQFDKLVMLSQRLKDLIDKSIKIPESFSSANFDTTLPTTIVGAVSYLIATTAAGTGLELGPSVPALAAQVAAAEAAQAAAEAAQAAAVVAQVAAELAETNAETAETNAETAETNAETAETNAEAAEALAEDWANKVDGAVDGSEYSAKAYAVGGTGVTDTATKGAAKEWAIETSGTVDGTDYSAKEWAKGTQIRGAASGGSAKDWATYTGGTVDDTEYSAKYYAAIAAISAGSPTFSTVTAAGAYAPAVVDGSRYMLFDATLGNQSLTLPAITPAEDGLTYTVKKIDASANTVTITGTVEGEVDPVIDQQYTGRTVVAINSAWYWRY